MYTYQLIRRGDYSDAHLIRITVFVEEQGFVKELDDLDDEAWHVIVYDGDQPAATARAFLNDEGLCKIGRVAVMRAYRGQHLGEQMMLWFEEELKKLGARRFKVSAQVRASGFYERLGYVRHGEEYLDEYCPHVDMYKPSLAEEAETV